MVKSVSSPLRTKLQVQQPTLTPPERTKHRPNTECKIM